MHPLPLWVPPLTMAVLGIVGPAQLWFLARRRDRREARLFAARLVHWTVGGPWTLITMGLLLAGALLPWVPGLQLATATGAGLLLVGLGLHLGAMALSVQLLHRRWSVGAAALEDALHPGGTWAAVAVLAGAVALVAGLGAMLLWA